MSDVIISGANGKMGTIVKDIVTRSENFNVVALFDPSFKKEEGCYNSVDTLPNADLIIDFCPADSIYSNCKYWIEKYKYIIVGSSGLTIKDINELSSILKNDQLLWIVPNFSIGAVLQKKWSIEASKYYKTARIEERHHAEKKDFPSGTSYDLANSLSNISSNSEDSIESNGQNTIINNIEINSIRDEQYLAEQQVLFSDLNEKLILEHISITRGSYEKGIYLSLKKYKKLSGLCIGLELVLDK